MRRAFLLATTALASMGLTREVRADPYGTALGPAVPAPPDDTTKGNASPLLPSSSASSGSLVDKPAARRAGIVLGFTYGVGIGSSSGYPNDSSLIGVPSAYSASGLMAGAGGGFFVMGALSDYLNFGFWYGSTTLTNAHWRSTGEGGGFRVDTFPLFGLGKGFRDLGVFGEFGIGGTSLEDKATSAKSTGLESFLGVGVFYEFWLFRALGGHFALGPSLEYDAIVTESMERHGPLLGARFLWYGGK